MLRPQAVCRRLGTGLLEIVRQMMQLFPENEYAAPGHRGRHAPSRHCGSLRAGLLTLWLVVLCALFPAVLHGAVDDGRYRTVAGSGAVPLEVTSTGDSGNPAILFLHGIGQSHFMFYRQFESSLAEDFFLVAFDLRGHGASGKPWSKESYGSARVWADDVNAVLDALQIDEVLIVAWSFGTLVAMDYLREYGPERVNALLMTGSLGAIVPYRMPEPKDEDDYDFAAIRALQQSRDPRDRARAPDSVVDWLVSDPLPADDRRVMEAYGHMFPSYARAAIYARSTDNTDLQPLLETLPVHVAMGSEDNAQLAIDAARLGESYPGVTLTVYDGAGHSVFYEQAQRFNEELRLLHERAIKSRFNTPSKD